MPLLTSMLPLTVDNWTLWYLTPALPLAFFYSRASYLATKVADIPRWLCVLNLAHFLSLILAALVADAPAAFYVWAWSPIVIAWLLLIGVGAMWVQQHLPGRTPG